MRCHLAGRPERLALDPKLHQGLRRKNQPSLVCSSTDYKGLGGFFYLPLWYGPNHGCQFSPVLLGSPSAFIFCFYSSLLCARLLLSFVLFFIFILWLLSMCTFTSDTFAFYSHFGNWQRAEERVLFLCMTFYCERLIIFQNITPAMRVLIPIQSCSYCWSEITKVNSTILPIYGL